MGIGFAHFMAMVPLGSDWMEFGGVLSFCSSSVSLAVGCLLLFMEHVGWMMESYRAKRSKKLKRGKDKKQKQKNEKGDENDEETKPNVYFKDVILKNPEDEN